MTIAEKACKKFKAQFNIGEGVFNALESAFGSSIKHVKQNGNDFAIEFLDGSVIAATFVKLYGKVKYYKWSPLMAKTKETATVEEILPKQPEPQPKPMSEAKQRIESLQQQILKEVDGLKTDLAKILNEACGIKKTLDELGQKNVLQDPQFAEFCLVLGIGAKAEEETEQKSKVSRGKAGDQIVDYLTKKEEPATVKEMQDKLGIAYLTVINNLKKLVNDKKVKEAGKDGRAVLYRIA